MSCLWTRSSSFLMTLPPCLLQPTAQDARRTSQGSVGQSQRAKATKLDDARGSTRPLPVSTRWRPSAVPSVLAVSSQPPPAGVGVGAVAGWEWGPCRPGVNTAVRRRRTRATHTCRRRCTRHRSCLRRARRTSSRSSAAPSRPPPPRTRRRRRSTGRRRRRCRWRHIRRRSSSRWHTSRRPRCTRRRRGTSSRRTSRTRRRPGVVQSADGRVWRIGCRYILAVGLCGPYTAPAPGYPAQYQAAQPAAQPQYQTAPPPAQAPQYPSYPPPTQPPPAPGGYQGMGVPMQGYNPVAHTAAPPAAAHEPRTTAYQDHWSAQQQSWPSCHWSRYGQTDHPHDNHTHGKAAQITIVDHNENRQCLARFNK